MTRHAVLAAATGRRTETAVRTRRPVGRARRTAWVLAGPLLMVLLVLVGPSLAQACSLDGIASLSVNGTRATLTAGTATATTARYWAPFTLLAVGRQSAVTLQEARSNVVKSLTAADMARPFRWQFADGGTARGWQVVHRFSQLGWQRLTVSYYWPAGHRWVQFDSAQLQVVPPGQVFRANLGTNLENLVGTIIVTALRVLVWGFAAVVAGAWIWQGMRRRRRRRAL